MALKGFGTLLQVEDSPGAGTYTTIGGVRDISGPTFEAEEIDVTDHDSANGFREYLQGLKDAGELTAEINFEPDVTLHDQLFDDLVAGTTREYRIRLAQMGTPYNLTFDAFVKSMPNNFPVGQQVTANLTLRITGAPVWSS